MMCGGQVAEGKIDCSHCYDYCDSKGWGLGLII